MLPWHLQSFLKAGWFLLSLGERGWVCSQVCGATLSSRPRLGECAGVCDPECAVRCSGPGLPGRAPDTLHWGGTGSPCPHHPAIGSRDLALAGLGDYPHSLCLWPGRASLPLLSSHKGQARRACCVRVSVAGGSLTSFSPAKPRGPRRVCQLVGGHCSSFTGERHRGDSAQGREG